MLRGIKKTRKKIMRQLQSVQGNGKKKARIISGSLSMVAGAVVLFVVMSMFVGKNYHSYEILQTSEQEDIVSTQYANIDDNILKYGLSEVSVLTDKLDIVWNEAYNMQNPVADVKGTKAVIADVDGTALEIFDINGRTGSVITPYAIVKARVSSSGMVAAILDDGEDTWINYYAPDGTLIAETQTKIEDPGYPLDVAISDDGTVLMVSYQFVSGDNTTSYVAFYNFGEAGQNEDSRIVSGYTYEDTLIPRIEYLGDNQSVALKDNGFTVYKGREVPTKLEELEAEEEIISAFCDDSMIGLVFKNENSEKPYRVEAYTSSGKHKFTKDFNIPYTTIKITGDVIVMYNSSQICIIDEKGKQKFMGEVDGAIKNLLKIGWNRYLLVLDSGVNVIKLS